jgi:hypothetical protein
MPTPARRREITEDEAFIDSLVTPGHASTPGFNDVSHFVPVVNRAPDGSLWERACSLLQGAYGTFS